MDEQIGRLNKFSKNDPGELVPLINSDKHQSKINQYKQMLRD
jgi:hypothetical protein